jgi:predicted N-acetyltransferase YhbS
MHLVVCERGELSTVQIRAVATLIWTTFPSVRARVDLETAVKEFALAAPRLFERSIMLWDGGELAAHALVFGRDIGNRTVTLRNMALAEVCVAEPLRGCGLGTHVVRTAFSYVEQGSFECSVFQTKVPRFYETLGARPVEGTTFVDASGTANAFRDPYAMVYPASAEIPPGIVSLRGPGY